MATGAVTTASLEGRKKFGLGSKSTVKKTVMAKKPRKPIKKGY